MYPFKSDDVFVRNAWYVAAMASEVTEKPLARNVLERPIVLFRTASGKAAAMHGLCPHRYYSLALHGKVVGEALQCNYHGYTFDGASGRCVRIPSQPNSPGQYEQRIYPVVERGPWVWIWTGDPALADPGRVPSLEELHLDARFTVSPMLAPVLVRGRYMLALENLMDLTHIAFLHSISVSFEEIVQAPLKISEDERELRVVRKMKLSWGMIQDAFYKPENRWEGASDADSETILHVPGYVTNTSSTPRNIPGVGPADPQTYGELWFHHVLTPETRHTTHYFGTQSRSHRHDDPGFSHMLHHADTEIRSQDIEAIQAIENNLREFGAPAIELMSRSDTAAARLRRRLQRAIDAESATAPSSPLAQADIAGLGA